MTFLRFYERWGGKPFFGVQYEEKPKQFLDFFGTEIFLQSTTIVSKK
jgi:mannose-1-phosphate guanylyltransferase